MAQRNHSVKRNRTAIADLAGPCSLLGHGLSVVKTASTAILASEKLGAEAETLEVGIKMISDAYAALDAVRG